MKLEIYAFGRKPLVYEVVDKDIAGQNTGSPLEAIQAAFQHESEAIRYVQQRYVDQTLASDYDALQAANGRLRAALARIESESCEIGIDAGHSGIHKIAREALAHSAGVNE